MAVSSSPSKNLNPISPSLLQHLKKDFSGLSFKAGTGFSWSASKATVTYKASLLTTNDGTWALLHELGHAELEHSKYDDDFTLLTLEVAAWRQARIIGQRYGIKIDDEHIQDCLDTYRDWLHARAKCPVCGVVSLQGKNYVYSCHNCKTSWKVPHSQLCRVKRTVLKPNK